MKSFSVILFSVLMAMLLVAITTVSSDDISKDEKPLNRLARASGKSKDTGCHYDKTPWSPCDEKTNVKTRTLTLKKGDDTCEKTKKMEKKCKKACRYLKGTWSQCNSHNEMIRTDTLKDPSTENSNCEKTRQITKKCKNKGRGNKGNKQNRSRQ